MKYISTLTAIAAFATMAIAQLSNLPSCALAPALSAITGSGCQATDIKCICSNTAFIAALEPAIMAACSADDQAKALTAAQGLCAQAGVSLVLPSTPATATAAPSSSAPAPSSASTTPTSSSAAVATTSTTASLSKYPTSTPTAPVNGTTPGNGTVSGSATPAAYTGAGAAAPTAVWQVAVGVVAAGAGFAVALL